MKQAVKFITVILSILLLLLPSNDSLMAKEWPTRSTDNVRKVWKVRLKMPLDSKSINGNSVYVLNGKTKHSTTVRLTNKGFTVEVTPNTTYQKGRSYRLLITSLVKTKSGKPLKTPVEIPFQIVDAAAKIQSVKTVTSGILTNVTVTTSPDVYKVKIGTTDMHYKGNNIYSYGLVDIKVGTVLTIYAYDENNKLLETKKYTIGK